MEAFLKEKISTVITTYLHTLRLFSRDVHLFLVTIFFFGFTVFGGIYGVLLNLYLLRLGYGPKFVGLINSGGRLSLAAFSLPAGALGRHWGSRRIMMVGTFLIVLGFMSLPFAESIPATLQMGWLVATYAIAWIGVALYFVNSNPFLTEITTSQDRNHAFSVRAALLPLAGFAGSLIGGLIPGLFARILDVSLDQPVAYRYTLLIAAVLIVPSLLALWATRRESVVHAQKAVVDSGPAPFGLIVFLSLVWLLRWAGSGAAQTFFNVYLDAGLGVPTAQIGALSATGQLLAIPVALSLPLLAARWGNGSTFVLGSLIMALGMVPLLIFPHWSAAGLGFIGVLALNSITRVDITVYQMESISPGWRTVMSGAATMAGGLGMAATAFGGGFMITALGYRGLFLAVAGFIAAGALLFWVHFRVKREEVGISSAHKDST